jgi:hypothetical protein
MLLTNPSKRITLPQVLSHPWMLTSYGRPPIPKSFPRKPLNADSLDPTVINEMERLGFRSSQDTQTCLVDILESDIYKHAVSHWVRHQGKAGDMIGTAPHTATGPSISPLPYLGPSTNLATTRRNKRDYAFQFYEEMLINGPSPSSMTSADSVGQPDDSVARVLEPNPIMGFHPVVSLYYLTSEHIRLMNCDGDTREPVYKPEWNDGGGIQLTIRLRDLFRCVSVLKRIMNCILISLAVLDHSRYQPSQPNDSP